MLEWFTEEAVFWSVRLNVWVEYLSSVADMAGQKWPWRRDTQTKPLTYTLFSMRMVASLSSDAVWWCLCAEIFLIENAKRSHTHDMLLSFTSINAVGKHVSYTSGICIWLQPAQTRTVHIFFNFSFMLLEQKSLTATLIEWNLIKSWAAR